MITLRLKYNCDETSILQSNKNSLCADSFIIFSSETVPRITLAASTRTTKDSTFFFNCSMSNVVVTSFISSIAELLVDCKRAVFNGLLDHDHAVSTKLCLIRSGPACVFKMASADAHLFYHLDITSLHNIEMQVLDTIPQLVGCCVCRVPCLSPPTPSIASCSYHLLGNYAPGVFFSLDLRAEPVSCLLI